MRGEGLSREEALSLLDAPLDGVCEAADAVRRARCGDGFDLCTIANGKSGRCPEDCRYCAQSACCRAPAETWPLKSGGELLGEAAYNEKRGVLRFSVVTSGRRLSPAELDAMCDAYRRLHETCGMSLCASHGLLDGAALRRLREAGVVRYHNNLETSRRFFPSVCTTHTYDDKRRTIRAAQAAGLEVCSGGILGLGETMGDRIDMALELRALGVRSVPLNILNPIPGTPLENRPRLAPGEARRCVALFRFLLPGAALRLAGGRGLYPDRGEALLRAGANAAVTGDMLTTAGVSIETDKALLTRLGYEVKRL